RPCPWCSARCVAIQRGRRLQGAALPVRGTCRCGAGVRSRTPRHAARALHGRPVRKHPWVRYLSHLMCGADTRRRHPGLTMMALREYHENAVVHCARNFGSNEPPSWESFCHQHFWAVMLANRSLVTAVGAATSSQLCCSFIAKRGLLLLSGSF